jgi:hypothetical protein
MSDVIDALKAAQRNTTPPVAFDLDESIRRGQRRRRRRRITNVGVGVAVAAGIAGSVLVLPDVTPDGPDPAQDATFAIFDEPQRAVDKLPPAVREKADRIHESSTRLVGEYEDLRYWLATNDRGDTCVVSAEDGAWFGTACGGGGWVQSGHPTSGHGFVTAFVFSDDFELEIADHAGFMVLSDNLAISTLSEGMRNDLAGVLEDAAEYFAILAEPQRPADRLPEIGNPANWALQEATTRYVGEYRDVQYWIGALSTPEEYWQICIVGVAAGGQWRGTSCSPPLNMPDVGPRWPVRHRDPDVATQLALVPDAYDLTEAESETWVQVAPNLYHDTAPD